MMKKLILLLAVVFMYSCDSEDGGFIDFENKDFETGINPPKWIEGEWVNTTGKEVLFTKSDLIIDPNDGNYKMSGNTRYYLDRGHDAEIVEIKTDTSYVLEFKESASVRRKFKFIKISKTEMEASGFLKGIFTRK